jgi:hypothetical protein
MSTFRAYQTVPETNQLVLDKVPFTPGERVEIVVRSCPPNGAALIDEWNKLMKATQVLPQVQRLTDDDIAAEVAAFRSNA